jgi:uncharacterized membrane protein
MKRPRAPQRELSGREIHIIRAKGVCQGPGRKTSAIGSAGQPGRFLRTLSTTQDHLSARAAQPPLARFRIESVDALRGVVMILMALDHTRDFLGTAVNPTNLAETTVFLFLTRWITHFCAPVFFLLTGLSSYLSLERKPKRELSKFLFARGLWLIFLELTLFRCLAFQFNFDYHVTVLNVLWALGWAMILLSALVHVPTLATAAIGIIMIAGHNLLDRVESSHPLWVALHIPGFILQTPQHSVFVAYPLIPWIGVTALGYSLGRIYAWTSPKRRVFLLRAGIALLAAFFLLRRLNLYGDPVRWAPQKSTILSVLSFLNTSKYPPSLLFLLMTLGPALLFLCAMDGKTPRLLRPVLLYGRVPMFYFLLHIPLIHLIAVVTCYLRYGAAHWMFESPSLGQFPVTRPPGWGFSLPFVYLIWMGVVLALYPACKWFAALKQRRKDRWLSYL